MNYSETITYLFDLQKFGIKLGLTNIKTILNHLGNPHERLQCIHIAGSNGKGSTGAFLQSILKHSGYQTGLYSSPHLIDFTERIRKNDQYIKKGRVVQLTKDIKRICKQYSLPNITFFEFVTALAFKYFEEEGTDPIIVEVGMGGRYDATNVIHPLISIITSINMEHQIYLGKTLQQIAREKAGIIKKGTPVISGVRQHSVKDLIRDTCKSSGAVFFQLGKDITYREIKPGKFNYRGLHQEFKNLHCGLIGNHQIRNASMAIAASSLLQKKGYNIQSDNIVTGIQKAIWPGRFEIIKKNPTIVLDGAHNPDAWRACKKTFETYFQNTRIVLLLGVMEDKDIQQMIRILIPVAYTVVFCRPKMDRAAKKEHIEKFIEFSIQKRIFWFDKCSVALKEALSMTSPKDLLCVTGSLFVVGEAREYLYQITKASGRIPL